MPPDLCKVKPGQATLLGSPIGGLESIDITLSEKLSSLKVLGTRLVHLHKQDALLLLRNAKSFIKELANRVKSETKEEKARPFLIQQLSVAVQRGNAAAVLGTSPHIGEAP